MISFRPQAKFDKSSAVILISEEQVKSKNFSFKNASLKKEISAILKTSQFSGQNGQLFPLIFNGKTILLVGVGNRADRSLTSLRITTKKALQSHYLSHQKDVEVIVDEQKDATVKAVIEGILIGTYRWDKYKSKDKKSKTVNVRDIFLVSTKKKFLDDAIKVCEATNFTRDLINDNADYITSEYFESVIRKLIKGKKHISIEVLNKKELKSKGLGLHLAVNQGSTKEPKLIIVKYHGSTKKGGYTALIGKGMTFDTGGLNLKPSGSIESMRLDMSGAATVLGSLKAAIDLKLKKNVIFACSMAENVTGSLSYKPGDVIKGYSGKTVEVANTDAEGRLVLADAISYIVKNYGPSEIIDIATLTGACIVALGYDYTGLVTTDDQFSRKLIRSSNETDDRVWRLPTYPELKDSVKSEIADIRNLGFPKGAGGTITAAEFLRQFTEGVRWAHLDIAGTSYVENHNRMYYGHGATGSCVRLLTHYLQNY